MITKGKNYWASFNRFNLLIPGEAIAECSHPGPCDNDVAFWREKVDLSNVPADALRDELREYGAWDADELSDDDANRSRILWIACGNIADEIYNAEKE